ncbi:MAG: family peptidase [Candidatus Thermoplasmatota archaeon]|nr:family peptidase [Candidatus Thermoplasmatota archaeon]
MFVVVLSVPVCYGLPAIGTNKPLNLTADEQAIMELLDYDHAWDQLVYLSSLGEKTSGSPEERAAQQYVFDELTAMPLDQVLWEEYRVANWDHFGTTVEIVSSGYEDVPATTYGDAQSVWGYDDGVRYAHGNEQDGTVLVANVVDVGYGRAADFDSACGGDHSLNGAIALVHRDDNTQGWPNTPAEEAALHGASAVMFYGYFEGADHPEGIKQDSVFSRIPAISISPNSAARLQELILGGPVTLEISGRTDFDPDARSVNVAGVLEGTTRADEYVVISGHIDTWWSGSFDDSSSIAIMLEMARMFSEARASGEYVNERTLVFCSMGSEESGGPDGTWFNWLVGSYEFVCEHPDMMDGLVLELNIDGGSFPKVDGKVWLEISLELDAFVWSAITDLGYLNVLNCYTPVWTWTDAWSFAGKGGGSAVEMVWGTGFDPYYHTQLDAIELQSEDMTGMVMELTALMAFRSVGALVVPIDFVPACDWAQQNLCADRAMVPSQRGNVDKALLALDGFEALASDINARADEIEAAYAAAKSPTQKAAAVEMADELNRAIIDARRIFIPWTMGEGGMMASWEPMLRPDQHATDYSAVSAAISALESGNPALAADALEAVRSMEWGVYCSREAYVLVLGQMMDCFMYWGDDFDQAQDYVDIQGVYLGLRDGSMSVEDALAYLEEVRGGPDGLEAWFMEDVLTLEREWTNACVPLYDLIG